MRRDLREGGVIASLVVQNENIPNLILIESKTKIPRVWGNLREDFGNLWEEINQDFFKKVQNLKQMHDTTYLFSTRRTPTTTMRLDLN